MISRAKLPVLLIGMLFFLSSCTSTGLPITDGVPTVTLPPAEVHYVAPIGDAALEYTDTAVLYLPSHDEIGLTAVETDVSFSLIRPAAESVVRALLAHPANRQANSLGGNVKLSLYGANPVEVSRDVATVNLSASALQLDRERLFIVCQAITNTLTELDGINHVNVLVVDKPVGLDIANSFPMGALQQNKESDLNTVYSQLLSRRASIGTSLKNAPFSSCVPLYFPLLNSDGLVCEARTISFESQNLSDLVTAIMRELALGPIDPNISSPPLPLLADLLTSAPRLSESPASGGIVVSLFFAHNLDDMLEAYGITRKQCTASLCYTLSSFLPNLSGIRLYINGEPVDSLMETTADPERETHTFLRSDFSSLIFDYCTLYYWDDQAEQLAPTQRAIPYYQSTNPRVLLCELAKGPQSGDSTPRLLPIMPNNAITDTSILGFALSEETLITNFAPSFSSACETTEAAAERALAYALVNTLCTNQRVRKVCFFQSGVQFDGFSGEIYWRGEFHPLPV